MITIIGKTGWQYDTDKRMVSNEKTGFCDYPILYKYALTVAYDYPGRVPRYVKNKVKSILLQLYMERENEKSEC